jgi:hypothetical protein
MTTFEIENYKVVSNGSDGGHYYISTEINFHGQTRKLIVLFKNKNDEKKLLENSILKVKGNLIDDGLEQSLMLLETELVN